MVVAAMVAAVVVPAVAAEAAVVVVVVKIMESVLGDHVEVKEQINQCMNDLRFN
jgi:hypothetical protein